VLLSKGVQRVMRIFGIRPYRRTGRKWRKKRAIVAHYANFLLNIIVLRKNSVRYSNASISPGSGNSLLKVAVAQKAPVVVGF